MSKRDRIIVIAICIVSSIIVVALSLVICFVPFVSQYYWQILLGLFVLGIMARHSGPCR